MGKVAFRPRRLGHVNLYVAELERSIRFYERVCGIELVRREPAIRGGFHSNGNTHHDVGLIEVSRGADRRGRDGKVQIAATRGAAVGLNHLGWEMENEAALVAAYRRLRDAGVPVLRASDHLISHSVYIADPDGNVHEFYADAIPDWRRIFNLDHEDLVTSEWDPLGAPPLEAANYPQDPPLRRVEEAPLHPRSITGATLATRGFAAMAAFLATVAGLSPLPDEDAGRRRAVFAGGIGRPDLTLVEAAAGEPVGLRSFSFRLAADGDLDRSAALIGAAGGPAPRRVRDGERDAIVLADPDGFVIELYRAPAGAALAPLAA